MKFNFINNKIYFLYFVIIVVILLILIFSLNRVLIKEGYEWSNQTQIEYEKYIRLFNPSYRFNIDVIKENANENEINHLLKYNEYPYKNETKQIFLNNVSHNNIIQTNPYFSLKENQSIYPEKIMLKKLGFNAKEGNFLLNGNILPNKDIVKCNIDDNGKGYMEKIKHNEVWNGYDELTTNGYNKCIKQRINNNDMEKQVPGFKFVNGVCNPCSILNDVPNFKCPFTLNNENISPVWKILWNLND
jgi:hypothetical protein